MVLHLSLPDQYGYVLLAATLSTTIPIYHALQVGSHRKLSGIRPPTLYATTSEAAQSMEKYLYNCAQRAHANFTENHTSFLATLLIAGLQYPLLSSAFGLMWSLARVMYAWGYVRPIPDGQGRMVGMWWTFPQLGLVGLANAVGLNLAWKAWLDSGSSW